MNKNIFYGVFVILILLGAIVLFKFGPEMTTASVSHGYKCVVSQEADGLVNDFGCEVVDEICTEPNFVGVRCP
ncbi:hypothetical protein ACFLZB_00755 [Nanoarchaeota archaeon]